MLIQKIKNYSLIGLSCLMITGCEIPQPDSLVINKLKQKINDKPDTAICLSVHLVGSFPVDIFDITGIYPYSDEEYQRAKQRFQFFQQQALLNEENIEIYDEKEDTTIQGKRYTLSEKGKQYSDDNDQFCFGNISVSSIEKIEDIQYIITKNLGKKIAYTYNIIDIPDWVKNPEFRSFYNLRTDLENAELKGETIYNSSRDNFDELKNHFFVSPF